MKDLRRHISLIAMLLTAWLPVNANALDFRSVAGIHAVMYDAPSAQAKKIYIVSPYTPVEVIVNLGEWVKVRDSSGELAWLESKYLNAKRTVVVTVPHIDAHESADTAASVTFRADKDVALELVDAANNGWAKVRHRDGMTGYVPSTQVWGL